MRGGQHLRSALVFRQLRVAPFVFGALAMALSVSAWCQETEQQSRDACTVEGLVVSSTNGQPVKRAQVTAQRIGERAQPRSRSPQPPPPQGALTDAAGRFVLSDLSPGEYSFWVTRNGYVGQGYGQTRPNSSGKTLTLSRGQRITNMVFRLVPMGVVTGQVYDEDGEPMSNVNVSALRRTYYGRRQLSPAMSASTNDRGEYRLINLSPGKYYLSAAYNSGYNTPAAKENYVPSYYPGSTDPNAATPVDISAGEELSGIDFTLTPVHAVRVRGQVLDAATSDPIASVSVGLMRPEGTWSGYQMAASTDSAGHFDLHAVPPGSYVLMAQRFDKNRQTSGRETIEVGDADLDGISLFLGPGAEIKGRVRREGNTQLNLDGLQINLQPQEPFGAGAPGARADAEGSFVLNNVLAGSYAINVCCPPDDFYLKAASLGSEDILDKGMTVASGGIRDTLDLLLSPAGGHIEGTVLRDEKLFGGATVALVPEPNRRNQPRLYFARTTDDQGRFILAGIPPGNYKLFAWERIEWGAFQDPDTLRRYEGQGKAVRVDEHSKLKVDVPLIAAEDDK